MPWWGWFLVGIVVGAGGLLSFIWVLTWLDDYSVNREHRD